MGLEIGPGQVVTGGGPARVAGIVLDTTFLTIAPTGSLNLRDNSMIVRSGDFATIYGYLVSGYNGGLWDGFGVNSSVAAGDPLHLTALGIIPNSEAHYASFEGRSTPTNLEIFVKFAQYGDANLDGIVNELDVALMGTGSGWYHGDFNYSGAVDAADYALLEAALPDAGPSIPEPGAGSLLMAGSIFLSSLRRFPRD